MQQNIYILDIRNTLKLSSSVICGMLLILCYFKSTSRGQSVFKVVRMYLITAADFLKYFLYVYASMFISTYVHMHECAFE